MEAEVMIFLDVSSSIHPGTDLLTAMVHNIVCKTFGRISIT